MEGVIEGVKSFDLCCEDAEVKNKWRRKIIVATGKPKFTWKMAITMAFVYVLMSCMLLCRYFLFSAVIFETVLSGVYFVYSC